MAIAEPKELELARPIEESKGIGRAAVLSTFFSNLLKRPAGSRPKAFGRLSEFSINTEGLAFKELNRLSRFLSSGDAAKGKAENSLIHIHKEC